MWQRRRYRSRRMARKTSSPPSPGMRTSRRTTKWLWALPEQGQRLSAVACLNEQQACRDMHDESARRELSGLSRWSVCECEHLGRGHKGVNR